MKNFNYTGLGTLSFTHQNLDYVVHGSGPHELPEGSELVDSLVKQQLLTEVQELEISTQPIEIEVQVLGLDSEKAQKNTQEISTNKIKK